MPVFCDVNLGCENIVSESKCLFADKNKEYELLFAIGHKMAIENKKIH